MRDGELGAVGESENQSSGTICKQREDSIMFWQWNTTSASKVTSFFKLECISAIRCTINAPSKLVSTQLEKIIVVSITVCLSFFIRFCTVKCVTTVKDFCFCMYVLWLLMEKLCVYRSISLNVKYQDLCATINPSKIKDLEEQKQSLKTFVQH